MNLRTLALVTWKTHVARSKFQNFHIVECGLLVLLSCEDKGRDKSSLSLNQYSPGMVWMLSTLGVLSHSLGTEWESSPFLWGWGIGGIFKVLFFYHTCPISGFQGLFFDLPQTI